MFTYRSEYGYGADFIKELLSIDYISTTEESEEKFAIKITYDNGYDTKEETTFYYDEKLYEFEKNCVQKLLAKVPRIFEKDTLYITKGPCLLGELFCY